ncbi:hypothetical protein PHYPO_G00179240 [Pangasianodon hypophthalmus]|uniref:Uncharacterized protein n=1 Tax=Pangasianodon hypophthalmus TaxID=310915 RepID=A0A5N5PS56_PANHP|nr:hypothetical protein PHYPO_G00179240 [Pangasianodon hypophthalmus]
MSAHSITRQVLTWNPQRKRRRGWPRNTWCHAIDADLKRTGHTWRQLEQLAQDQDAWRALAEQKHSWAAALPPEACTSCHPALRTSPRVGHSLPFPAQSWRCPECKRLDSSE